MINQKNNVTFFEQIQSRLTKPVTDYATLVFAFADKNKVFCTFERNDNGEQLDLVFDSRAHVELWAESCEKYPDLVPFKFENRKAVN